MAIGGDASFLFSFTFDSNKQTRSQLRNNARRPRHLEVQKDHSKVGNQVCVVRCNWNQPGATDQQLLHPWHQRVSIKPWLNHAYALCAVFLHWLFYQQSTTYKKKVTCLKMHSTTSSNSIKMIQLWRSQWVDDVKQRTRMFCFGKATTKYYHENVADVSGSVSIHQVCDGNNCSFHFSSPKLWIARLQKTSSSLFVISFSKVWSNPSSQSELSCDTDAFMSQGIIQQAAIQSNLQPNGHIFRTLASQPKQHSLLYYFISGTAMLLWDQPMAMCNVLLVVLYW